ncbi:MAG TPA: cytochrome c [Thermoanaerobaculia bacterium]|nr:cytochrome c [Thermoanaerobaculia bacterium]
MGTNPAPATTASPDGQSVFKAKGCGVCHGASGAGDTPMAKAKNIPDFRSSTVQSKSDADLVKIIREAPQHAAKAVTADQAKALVAWIRSLK